MHSGLDGRPDLHVFGRCDLNNADGYAGRASKTAC